MISYGQTLLVDDVLLGKSEAKRRARARISYSLSRIGKPWMTPFDIIEEMTVLEREHEIDLPAISEADRIASC